MDFANRGLAEENALKVHLAELAQPDGMVSLREPGEVVRRGYVNEDGTPTENGELFVDLQSRGIFDADGLLTEKGRAFAMDRLDALQEQNLSAYIIREKEGLNDTPDISMGSALEAAGGYVWDAVKGLGRILKTAPTSATGGWIGGPEMEAEALLSRQSFVEGAIEGGAQLAAGARRLGEKVIYDPADENNYYHSKQKFERAQEDIRDLEMADYLAVIDETNGAVMAKEREEAVKTLGPEAAAVIEQGRASGSLFGDPSNIATAGVGAGVGAGSKVPILARLSTKVDEVAMAALKAEELATVAARAKMAASKTSAGAQVAARMADDLAGTNAARSAQFREVANRLGQESVKATESIPVLQLQASDAAIKAAKLAEASGGAQRVLSAVEQAKQIGRQVRSAPARVMGPALEAVGNGMMKVDSWIDANMKAAANLRGAGAIIGIGTGNPLYAIPQMLAAGPAVRGVGNWTKVIGQELAQARGTVPFWQRVAENSSTTPLGRATAHAMDFATLGGKIPMTAGRVAKGIAAAAPVDIGFEIVASGGDVSPSTLKQGIAESILFGGGGALGGAILKGNLRDMRARSAGDEINFRKTLSPEDTAKFSRMNGGARKNLSTYAASFPNMGVRLVEDGPSSFDRRNNTATINVRQTDWMEPVVAHEINHFLQVSGQAEEGIRAMLLGDGQTGGILRAKDGTLDRNFREFSDAYNKRLRDQGSPPLSTDEMAIEYFTEATVDDIVRDTRGGKLQSIVRRSKGEQALRNLIASTVPKMPIIRDLFYRLGGAIDSKGRMVQGNGLLAGGVREIPGARKMIRDLIASESKRGKQRLPEPPPTAPITITNPVDQKPLVDSMYSIFETDPEGNVIVDDKGVPTVISKETEKARKTAGKEALKVIDREAEAEADALDGKTFEDPEPLDTSDPVTMEEAESETPEQKGRRVKRKPDGKYEGTHFSPKALQSIRKGQKLNKLQMQHLRMLNRASRDMSGAVFDVINHPALKTDAQGKKSYDSMGATFRKVVPIGMSANKAGGIFVTLLSVTQLVENIRNRASSDKGKRLYGGNELAIRNDVEAVVDLWRDGKKSDDFFQSKYGAKWRDHKNFINSVFGNTGTTGHKEANPVIGEDGLDMKTNTIKSYRIDRLSKVARAIGDRPLPVSYDKVKLNYLPLGTTE